MAKTQVDKKSPLSEPQKEAVGHAGGPLLVAAGAGSGKTRTLVERLVFLLEKGVPPEKIIAITFTNKAADEMKKRVRESGVLASKKTAPFVGTFHSFAARILRKEAAHFGRDARFVIFDEDDAGRVVRRLARNYDMAAALPKLRKSISRIKNKLLNLEEEDEPTRMLFEAYEKELARQNAFDFDDLIEKTVRLFMERPDILKKYERAYSHVLVDEYQDINTAQYALLKLLCKNHRNLTVVGDDQQSIYGFRWSDFTNFLNFERDWPEARVVHLGENYRSSGTIVRAAASVIENNALQRRKKLFTKNNPGAPVYVFGAASAEEEADAILREIVAGHTPGEKAVLYRTNAQSRAIEAALGLNAIPYEIFGGITFYERKEVKDIVAALRYGINPKDEISRERIEKTFRRPVARALVNELPEMAEKLAVLELLGYILKTTDYFEYLRAKFKNAEERIENVSELVGFASGFQDIPEFLTRVSLLQATDNLDEAGKEPIKLMTIHLAKGLEFDEVYVAGVAEGLLPHQRSFFSDDDIEEERRLAYVAMTRAKHRLQLSFYGFASRFLYEIPPELVKFVGADMPEAELFID